MNGEKIYPNADASEVIANAKKSHIGRFFKQYKKGDFIYTTEKRPFEQRTMTVLHILTKTVFNWNPYFLEWEKMGPKFDEF